MSNNQSTAGHQEHKNLTGFARLCHIQINVDNLGGIYKRQSHSYLHSLLPDMRI